MQQPSKIDVLFAKNLPSTCQWMQQPTVIDVLSTILLPDHQCGRS
jgi:hypothetical protein